MQILSPAKGKISRIDGNLLAGEAVDVRKDETVLFSISSETSRHTPSQQAAAPAQAPTQAVGTGDVDTMPLTRHQKAMLHNMTVQTGDTIPFILQESVDFSKISSESKAAGVSPLATLIHRLAEAAHERGYNKKLSADKNGIIAFTKVNIGVAIEVDGQLRVAVVRDVLSKSLVDIKNDVSFFASKGGKLSMADQDLSKVCWVVSSMGKHAATGVIPVLPKGTTGIVGVGRTNKDGAGTLSLSICHATLTGMEGADLVRAYADKLGRP